MNIHAYLTFHGQCREAMVFYQQCLGGELTFLTIGESPLSKQMPANMKDLMLHAILKNENLVLLASDMVGDEGLTKGNAVSLMLQGTSESEIRKMFEKLAQGALQKRVLEQTFWGALFGDLTDKYGNCWLLHFQENKVSN